MRRVVPVLCLVAAFIGCSRSSKINIHDDTDEHDTIAVVNKPTINVYIENSGSMDGYVNGNTQFKEAVFGYLSDVKISGIMDSLNLFYINSQIIQFGSDVQDFIEKLDPVTFRNRGGNRQTTDISNVIKSIMSDTRENNLSILATDGIFSPGRGKDADEYLVNQQIGIKINVADFIKKNPDASVLVYKLSSRFKGLYYNKTDFAGQIDEQRPFYIWIIGDAKHVGELRTKIPEKKFKGSGIEDMFSITTGNKSISYAIKLGSGNFGLDKKEPRTTIIDWRKNSRGQNTDVATFSVNADMSGLLLDDTYLMDPHNYALSDPDFTLSVTKATNNSSGYTHSLNLSSRLVKKTNLSVKLKSSMPKWVEDTNDSIGDAPVRGKTYGIKHQIHGVYEAFTHDNDCYAEIKIFIK